MKTFLTALSCLAFLLSFAQKQDANWVFGYNCGLNFDNATVSSFYASIHSLEASASISDSDGELRFYVKRSNPQDFDSDFIICGSNGDSIINGGSILIHTSATNGAIFLEIIPDSLYFLVHTGYDMPACVNTTTACYRLYLTKIEKRNQGWTVTDKNRLLTSKLVTEKLAVTRHGNGKDWWIVTQANIANEINMCTNEYLIFCVNKDSIVSSNKHIGRPWCNFLSFAGEMVFSKEGNYLACAIGGDYYLRTLQFNRCSGELFNYHDTILGNFREPYSVEYSPNEKVLYVVFGVESPPEGVMQINLYSGQHIQNIVWNYSVDGAPGQLQLAADGKIYLSSIFGNYYVDDTVNKHLTVINQPDSIGLACDLSVLGFYVGDSCRTRGGLPNMPNYNLGALPVYMADAGRDTFYCAGDETIKALPIGGDSIYGIIYEWQPAPGIDTLTNRTQLVLPPPQSRWYYVTLIDTNYVGPSCNSRLDSVYVEVRNCDTVGITEVNTFHPRTYPNPTTGTLTVELPGGEGGSIALYNLLGQSVYQTPINASQTTIDINLSPGIYLYRISSGDKTSNGKLVVEE